VRKRGLLPGLACSLLISGVLAACGSTSAAPARPPTAKEILAKPEKAAGLTSAHFTLTAAFPVATGVLLDMTGDGVIVYKPDQAARITFHGSSGGRTLDVVVLTVGGTDYTMVTPGPGKWSSSPTTSNPAKLSDSTSATYVGEDTLPQGKAWHVTAVDKDGNPIELWVRESDGYPLKYTTKQSTGASNGNATLTFDKFNTGETVTAPPPAQVQAS
jgi:outer membrane lipoprotein-sorting protein